MDARSSSRLVTPLAFGIPPFFLHARPKLPSRERSPGPVLRVQPSDARSSPLRYDTRRVRVKCHRPSRLPTRRKDFLARPGRILCACSPKASVADCACRARIACRASFTQAGSPWAGANTAPAKSCRASTTGARKEASLPRQGKALAHHLLCGSQAVSQARRRLCRVARRTGSHRRRGGLEEAYPITRWLPRSFLQRVHPPHPSPCS